jgi:hypothetical protein
MITELLLITLIFTWAFATGIDQIRRGLGLWKFKDAKEQEDYSVWVKKEGDKKVVFVSVSLLVLFIIWVYALVSLI